MMLKDIVVVNAALLVAVLVFLRLLVFLRFLRFFRSLGRVSAYSPSSAGVPF